MILPLPPHNYSTSLRGLFVFQLAIFAAHVFSAVITLLIYVVGRLACRDLSERCSLIVLTFQVYCPNCIPACFPPSCSVPRVCHFLRSWRRAS